MSTFRYLLGGLLAATILCLALAPAAKAEIDVSEIESALSETQAGATADYTFRFRVAPQDPGNPNGPVTGSIMDQVVELPKGFIGDVTKFETCPMSRVAAIYAVTVCPTASVVGVATVYIFNGASQTVAPIPYTVRVYRVEEYAGEAAAFGLAPLLGYTVRLSATVDPSNGYRVKVSSYNQQAGAALVEATVKMWGVPAEFQGTGPLNELAHPQTFGGPMPATVRRHRFVSVPARCDGPAMSSLHIASWQNRVWLAPWETSAGTPTGCEDLIFSSAFEMRPTVKTTSTPSGYRAVLQVGKNLDPASLATPNLKDAVVKLPAGVAISAATANGLEACTDEQLAIDSAVQEKCPPASKIGEVSIETPVLDDAVQGEIFAGEQLSDDPASGQMFRIFIVATSDGVKVKLRGQIAVDPDTGQVTATFVDNPDLPVGRMTLDFKGGDGAPLTTPPTCGNHSTESSFTSWAGQSTSYTDTMGIDGACAQKGFAPKMNAGSTNPVAGGTGQFVLAGSRTDADQEVKNIRDIKLPKGLLGDVGSVELCSDANAAAGNCPAGSRVGHVQVAVGLGKAPVWVPQAGSISSVSLTGPYKGAPYGLSIVVPAKAGPFDLGKVVVRSALNVDERTVDLSTGIDESRIYNRDGSLHKVIAGELPTVIKGVPLQAKEIRVIVDRKDFLVNPTNCEPQQVSAVAVSVSGATAQLANRFQVGDCASLGFAPRFNARILDKGRKSTLRSFHPRTRFTVVPRRGDANIAGARVVLPSSTLLDQANIGTTCTRAQMAERNCPEASIVGYARAWSPLLRKAVEGPVYLAANGGVRPLPDLAAVLDGEIRVVLQGEIATRRGGGKARLQNTFRVVPDAPVSRFVLTMQGGNKRGLLVNSTDLCRSKERGVAVFHGQNGRSHKLQPRIATSFRGCGKVRRQAARRAAARRAIG